jgi:molecular chaperone GrpE
MATEQDMAAEAREADRSADGEEQAAEAGAARTDADELLLSLQDANVKADEYWNQLLRARAEMANQQRRAERDLENAHKYGLEKFASELLPVIDGIEMGLKAAADGDKIDPVKLREGMELTFKILASTLEKFGVREINPAGGKFNPALHQAMAAQPSPDVEPNTVLAVYQKGYLLNDRLIRPAMVVVSAGGPGKPGVTEKKIDEMA